MRRWVLSKKDKKLLFEEIARLYPGVSLSEDAKVEVVVLENVELYLFDSIPAYMKLRQENRVLLIPHLKYLLRINPRGWMPVIVVDEGAVKPILRGADLMRPGIKRIEGVFKAGNILVIVEPSRSLPIAVHRALYSTEEIQSMEKGRVTKSLHYVNDEYWKIAERV